MPGSRRRNPLEFEVVDASWVTRSMRRVVLTSDEFDTFLARDGGFTDRYVKLVFLDSETTYPRPLDMESVRETLPREVWPVLRTYTVRWIDRAARTIAIDFVVHGDVGLAGPWAAGAAAGDRIHLNGPGGAYAPAAEADWHLVAGDDAALPAVVAALEAMPDGARVRAFVEVDGPEDEQPVTSAADLDLTWLHRNGAAPGSTTLIPDAVKQLAWPAGRAQVFIHGESGLLKALRSQLLDERGVAKDDLSFSGYWRRGTNEEGFRVWKAEQAKADVA
ncbi:siderophore-interacting protein [Solicola gregarius]|uniref:Siderophore-interacting protein n=1 Tax=Solicola gregarius TaxID=2908642 RepID=A0AA46YKX4_9ACTN|nr:siderophore-interacting protein [Solicola gregarius]UYM04348.1 siderophore-interacting protein [Solicola gregarius]